MVFQGLAAPVVVEGVTVIGSSRIKHIPIFSFTYTHLCLHIYRFHGHFSPLPSKYDDRSRCLGFHSNHNNDRAQCPFTKHLVLNERVP